jgi:hypothetical protein
LALGQNKIFLHQSVCCLRLQKKKNGHRLDNLGGSLNKPLSSLTIDSSPERDILNDCKPGFRSTFRNWHSLQQYFVGQSEIGATDVVKIVWANALRSKGGCNSAYLPQWQIIHPLLRIGRNRRKKSHTSLARIIPNNKETEG